MKKGFLFFLLIMFSLLLSACSRLPVVEDYNLDDSRVSVVAVSFPGYDFARAVAGESADITMLLAPGEETHSYDPTPADIIKIENCDLFIYTGGESDEWVEDILSSSEHPINSLSMMSCVDCFEEETTEGMMDERESEIDETGAEYDEHVWTSPVNAIRIVNSVSDSLCEIDPRNETAYMKNASLYSKQISEIDAGFRDLVSSSENRTLIFGDRFPFLYFVKEYGLDYYAAFPGCSSETEPNAATISFLIDKSKFNHVSVILKEAMSNDNIASAIAEENGAKVLSLYACHNIPADDFNAGETYVSLMRQNLAVLKEALN